MAAANCPVRPRGARLAAYSPRTSPSARNQSTLICTKTINNAGEQAGLGRAAAAGAGAGAVAGGYGVRGVTAAITHI